MFQPAPLLPADEPATPSASTADTVTADASAAEVTATLLVGDFESRCGNCHKPTYLQGVRHHTDISGWRPQPGGGCGARFVNIASLSRAVTAARLRELRPDLPVRGENSGS
ncbi:hypothetical protein [Streptomyces syringium]|uniref:hypothetical protein n=1 Tax=Streptomyces syringium TaxID=76729 RepID=UPI003435AD04